MKAIFDTIFNQKLVPISVRNWRYDCQGQSIQRKKSLAMGVGAGSVPWNGGCSDGTVNDYARNAKSCDDAAYLRNMVVCRGVLWVEKSKFAVSR